MSASLRRQPVAQGSGGLFSTQKVSFSAETQKLLKVMMEESKLTNFQQRQLREKMQTMQPLPLRCNPTSSKQGGTPPRRQPKSKSKPPHRGGGLRSKDVIEKMTDREPEYRPPPCRYNSSKEKVKLQNVMAFGSELEPTPTSQHSKSSRPQPREEEEVDRFEEVLKEIEERRQFLDEMEALGQGKQYRAQIMTEISQKIHELEVLDKQRCSELTKELK